jgi:WhiB family redox-sensing transcriptional regulator
MIAEREVRRMLKGAQVPKGIPCVDGGSRWRDDGACRQEDPELFFPIGTTGAAAVQIEKAQAVCRRCPVTQTCLSWALETGQDAGVWGGSTEEERRSLRRRNARQRRVAGAAE